VTIVAAFAGWTSDLSLVDDLGNTAMPMQSDAKDHVGDVYSLPVIDPWFASELSTATISRNPNPLPELLPSASASASPTASPTRAIELPSTPTMPGLPAPTPVRTDEFGLPVVP
jgi:hypothetical protein